ncbi:MAG TPA: flagellar export protein FliJ [Chloroflexota bacterium]|jgi:flagellar export protein FliJ|nr:flagellar export protein FliJ [Chloroflexota bacterium]
MAVPRHFRLERVLRLREQREKELQGQLARAYQQQVEQQTLLGRMEDNRARQIELITHELTSDRVEMTYVQFGGAYLERLQSLIDRQSNVVKQASRVTDRKRVEVHQAMKARKVIEKLREHWRGDVVEEDRQREIKTIDEISTVSYNRRRQGVG